MITAIRDSRDLAEVLNSAPRSDFDGAETPRDWVDGIWVAGTTYPLDPDGSSDTLAVLGDGTAAAVFSPQGEYCGGGHRTAVQATAAHWCPADRDEWTAEDDARGVVRDWRSVRVWDANGFAEATTHPTVEEAKSAFRRERAELRMAGEPMSPAAFKATREFLGLAGDAIAGLLAVAGRTVRHWEDGRYEVPEGVAWEVRSLEAQTDRFVAELVKELREWDDPEIEVFRTDAGFLAAHGAEWAGFTASWHRAVAARVAREVPGLVLSFAEDAPEED